MTWNTYNAENNDDMYGVTNTHELPEYPSGAFWIPILDKEQAEAVVEVLNRIDKEREPEERFQVVHQRDGMHALSWQVFDGKSLTNNARFAKEVDAIEWCEYLNGRQ